MSPVMITHLSAWPSWKFASFGWPVNELKRIDGSAALKPDWPPSPQTIMSQLIGEWPFGSHVPLSWVPPMRSAESVGLTDRLWNWSVDRPLFSPLISVGTRD